MWSVLTTEIRTNTAVPYFRQHRGDQCAWDPHVDALYARLKLRMIHYMPRYSSDLLTRYFLTVFDDKAALDEFQNDPWWQIRERSLLLYCDSRNIIHDRVVIEHASSESLENYKSEIVSRTWPRDLAIIMDFPMIGTDRLVTNAVKPENDQFQIHTYFNNL